MIEQQTVGYLTLQADAQRIYQLLLGQADAFCMSQCPIIEEVIDTQLFGFAKEVDFAKRVHLISAEQGATLMRTLEERINQLTIEMIQDDTNRE